MLTGHHCSDPFMRGAVSMKSISQVARLTGISVRTLQYYDEIGLLKPSELTSSGYRLYDDNALQTLQQILFFKELGFPLKEIKEILEKPDFDRIAAFKKQKELFLLKRDRLDRLIQLLERLEKGEQCMSFKEFDLSDYINALEDFKSNQTDTIMTNREIIRELKRRGYSRVDIDTDSRAAKTFYTYRGGLHINGTEDLSFQIVPPQDSLGLGRFAICATRNGESSQLGTDQAPFFFRWLFAFLKVERKDNEIIDGICTDRKTE